MTLAQFMAAAEAYEFFYHKCVPCRQDRDVPRRMYRSGRLQPPSPIPSRSGSACRRPMRRPRAARQRCFTAAQAGAAVLHERGRPVQQGAARGDGQRTRRTRKGTHTHTPARMHTHARTHARTHTPTQTRSVRVCAWSDGADCAAAAAPSAGANWPSVAVGRVRISIGKSRQRSTHSMHVQSGFAPVYMNKLAAQMRTIVARTAHENGHFSTRQARQRHAPRRCRSKPQRRRLRGRTV